MGKEEEKSSSPDSGPYLDPTKTNGRWLACRKFMMSLLFWLRGVDLNHRPLGYEPNELPDCSTPQFDHTVM